MKTVTACLAAVTLLAAAAAAPAAPDHPHGWIKKFRPPGSASDCCGGADCVALAPGALAGKKVGDAMFLPAVGAHEAADVTILAIYPAPAGSTRGWGCHTGCFFQAVGF